MKKIRVIFIIIFILCLLLPALGMPFFKKAVNSEKREPAKFPSLNFKTAADGSFGKELENWAADHIGFRNSLIGINNALMRDVFGQQDADIKVLIGKDGWLYFKDDIKDYCNERTLSDRNINNIAASLAMLDGYIKEKGLEFEVCIVPNKSCLYEHMPSNYIKNEGEDNYRALLKAFEKKGINHTDLFADFKADGRVLYRKEDTHWDYKGALLAYNAIMKQAGLSQHMLDNVGFGAETEDVGDLAQMLYLDKAEPEVLSYPESGFSYETVSREKAANAIFLETYNEKAEDCVLFYRDSYLDTMHIYCAESFGQAVFSRALPYDLSYVDKYMPKLTVLEIVERNIADLAKRAPMMEASETAVSAAAETVGADAIKLKSEKKNSYMHFYGEIDESLLGDEYRAYIYVNGGEAASYEAFPVYEMELLGSDKLKDNGFSAYIPAEKAENAEIYVIVESNGKYYMGN